MKRETRFFVRQAIIIAAGTWSVRDRSKHGKGNTILFGFVSRYLIVRMRYLLHPNINGCRQNGISLSKFFAVTSYQHMIFDKL